MKAGPPPRVIQSLAAFFAAEIWPEWLRETRGESIGLTITVVWWPDGAVGLDLREIDR